MRALLILLLYCCPVQADYFYARLGLGTSTANCDCWVDGDSIGGRAMLGYRHHLGGQWYADANFLHHSQPFVGKPFNDDDETSSYHLFYDIEYRWD